VGQEEELFLDITEPVWTPASSCEGKVVGQHRFPFSITLPRDATIAPVPKAAPKCFSLPPTFSERASPAYIDYRLFVTVRRGRLRVDKQCVSSSTPIFKTRHPTIPVSADGKFVRIGCQRTLRFSRVLWQNRHLLYARSRMLKAE
jgi:hypothetical protein